MEKSDCIFCKVASGEIPSKTIYEDDDFKVILDMGPATEGHSLIIPKAHASDLFDLPDEIASKVMVLAKRIGEQMMDKLNCEGLNVIQNSREASGQTVFHFHTHLIPRYKGDNQTINWVSNSPTQDELENTRKKILE